MKKEMIAGLLTMTAAFAPQFAAPSFAEARALRAEKAFPDEFNMVAKLRVRYLDRETRQYIEGKVFVTLKQVDVQQQEFPNHVKGEMQGFIHFKSDELLEDWSGQKRPRYEYLGSGDDGSIILDRIHADQDGHVYRAYGCDSTMTKCVPDSIAFVFKGKSAKLRIEFAADSAFEIFDEDNQEWSKHRQEVALERTASAED